MTVQPIKIGIKLTFWMNSFVLRLAVQFVFRGCVSRVVLLFNS